MAKVAFQSVDDYIASLPAVVQPILERVRSAIRQSIPEAEEAISYNMASYKVNGRAILYFAGWKKHYSLYPAGERLVAAFQDELTPYEVEKGTIRFPLADPVPVRLIGRIAKFRVKEEGERTSGKFKSRKTTARKS